MAENGLSANTYAFIDSGSSASFISRSLLKELSLKRSCRASYNVFVSTLTGRGDLRCDIASNVSVISMMCNEPIHLPPLYTIDKIQFLKISSLRPHLSLNHPLHPISRPPPSFIFPSSLWCGWRSEISPLNSLRDTLTSHHSHVM